MRFLPTFVAELHNSITNHLFNCSKNEHDDKANSQASSGSMMKLRTESENRQEDCTLSFCAFFEATPRRPLALERA